MRTYLKKRPMLLYSILISFIIPLCIKFNFLLLFFAVVFIVFCLYFCFYKAKSNYILPSALCFLIIISLLLSFKDISSLKNYENSNSVSEFTVIQNPQIVKNYYKTEIQIIKSDYLKKGTKISTLYSGEALKAGDIASANIKLSPIKKEYILSDYSNKIYMNGFLSNISILNSSDKLLKKKYAVREYISKTLFTKVSFKQASTLCGLIYGEKSFLSDDFKNNIKYSGVSHVLVISGIHLTIILYMFTAFFEKIIYNKFIKLFLTVIIVLLVTFICGASMSILRAGITAILSAFAIILNRENNLENSLGTAVLIIYIFYPFAIFNLSFQLSVLSTFGIVVLSLPIIKAIIAKKNITNKFLITILSLVLVSLGAYIMTMPVCIYQFEFLSLVSLITNILISNAVTIVLIVTIIALIFNLFCPILSALFFYFADIITRYINFIINYFGTLKYSVITINKFAFLYSVIFIILIICTLFYCKKHYNMIKLKNKGEDRCR